MLDKKIKWGISIITVAFFLSASVCFFFYRYSKCGTAFIKAGADKTTAAAKSCNKA